jgi:NADH-quinone oxidoreductase subunit C
MNGLKEPLIESNILELDNRLDIFFSVGNIFLKNILILKNNFINDISCFLLKSNNNISIFLKKNVFNIVFFLKNSSYFSFSQLLDFTVIDRLEMSIKKDKRFEFFYLFVSTIFSYRIFLRGFISSFESIKSLSVLYYSSVWLEREVWDMFGIFIVEHPDLRRILTDYGFLGHPFRKDFPLSGYVELRYDETNKYIIAEPLELSQEFRFFKFDNPWKK